MSDVNKGDEAPDGRSRRWSRAGSGSDEAQTGDARANARNDRRDAKSASERSGGRRSDQPRSGGFRADRSDRQGGGSGRSSDRARSGGPGRDRGESVGRSEGRRFDRDRRGAVGRDRREGDERSQSAEGSGQRGPRSWDRRDSDGVDRRPRMHEPALPEDITGKELDRSVWVQLRTLTKDNAEGVARHLVAAASFLEVDPDLALDHAEHAARRAGRVPAVREALGLVRYRRGEFTDALREFRTARRLSGSDHLLPYMVDCERGLGRYERALELAADPAAKRLGEADNIELAIVVSGVRRDLGQPEAALIGLRIPALERATTQPWAARLFYAYAEALLATGDPDGARDWFLKAAEHDDDEQTDAAERVDELDGVILTEVDDSDDD